MFKKITLAAAFIVAGAVPALAQGACTAPPVPVGVNGATATKDQMVTAHKAVMQFMSDSTTYQTCLQTEMDAGAAAAKTNNTTYDNKPDMDAAAANQAAKEKVGADYNTAVVAYKAQTPAK